MFEMESYHLSDYTENNIAQSKIGHFISQRRLFGNSVPTTTKITPGTIYQNMSSDLKRDGKLKVEKPESEVSQTVDYGPKKQKECH